MPIEIEKIQEYMGIKADTTEGFIEEIGKKYYTEDQIFKDPDTKTKMFGRAFGSATTGVKQLFDSEGIELSGDDLKQPIEAVVKTGMQKIREKFAAEKAELERTAGLTADEKIKEVSENLTKAQAKVKDFEQLLKQKATEFENLTANNKNELKKFKLSSINKDVTGSVNWNPDVDEYKKKGFLVTLQERYDIDLDENDEPFIVDKTTKSRIKAEGSHSSFMTPHEVYKMESVKAGLAAVNKNSGKPAPINKINSTFTPQSKSDQNNSTTPFKKQIAATGWKRPQ